MSAVSAERVIISRTVSVYVRLQARGERVGSIAGFLAKEGSVSGNCFVSDTFHAVDDISYAGSADKVTYEDIMSEEQMPEGFGRVTIVFETEDDFIAEKEIPYGGSLTVSDFPDLEEKEGCYVKWPDEKELCDIRQNLTVTAEYVPWTESIAGDDTLSDGRAAVIAVGEFYEETQLHLTETDGPANLGQNQSVEYAYTWKLAGNRDKKYDIMTLHLAKPAAADTAVSVWIKEKDSWKEIPADEDGSYLVASVPSGAAVAVVSESKAKPDAAAAAGAAALLAATIIFWCKKKGRAGKAKKKEKKKKMEKE